jgi:hypothetical protein
MQIWTASEMGSKTVFPSLICPSIPLTRLRGKRMLFFRELSLNLTGRAAFLTW